MDLETDSKDLAEAIVSTILNALALDESVHIELLVDGSEENQQVIRNDLVRRVKNLVVNPPNSSLFEKALRKLVKMLRMSSTVTWTKPDGIQENRYHTLLQTDLLNFRLREFKELNL